jgi:hypothetical protein
MAYKDVILADSPALYWRMNDTGTTTADSAGSHTGTLAGTVTKSVAGALAGDSDTAMTFDGSTGKVTTPDATDLKPAAISVELWAKYTVLSDFAVFFTKTTSNSWNDGYGLYYRTSGTTLNWWVNNYTGANMQVQITAPATGGWHHIVGTYDGTNGLRLYVDGSQAGSNSYVSGITQSIAILNLATHSGGTSLAATIDEFAVYGTALSAAKVLAHYQSGTYPFATVTYAATSN